MIYLLKVEYKIITLLKIGYTADTSKDNRYTAYKLHNPLFELLYEIPGCSEVLEKKLQKYFSEYRYKDYGKEWFVWNEEIIDYFKNHTTEESLVDLLSDVSSHERTLSNYKNYVKNLITKVLNYKVSLGEISIESSVEQLPNLVDYIINTKRIRSIERLWKYINNNFNITQDALNNFLYSGISPAVNRVLANFDLSNSFPERMRAICENDLTEDEIMKVLELIPIIYKNYYLSLGKAKIKSLSYRKTLLNQEYERQVNNQEKSGDLIDSISERILVGNKYTRSEIKDILKSIYQDLGITGIPKALDLEKYFELRKTQITDRTTGKRDHGFEILKKKEK